MIEKDFKRLRYPPRLLPPPFTKAASSSPCVLPDYTLPKTCPKTTREARGVPRASSYTCSEFLFMTLKGSIDFWKISGIENFDI